MNQKPLKFFFVLMLLSVFSNAQNTRQYVGIKTAMPPEIDGVLSEKIWQKAEPANNFFLNYPLDTGKVVAQTSAFLCYDDENLYVAAICFFEANSKRNVRTLRRDFSEIENDAFSLILNPLNDATNGFMFTISPRGVLSEALIHSGSRTAKVWDNKWSAETHIDSNYWSLEMAIPFKTLRFDSEIKDWGINFVRNEIATNEISSWQAVPREFSTTALGYTGKLVWTENPPSPANNISLIPYLTSGLQTRLGQEPLPTANAGIDAKVGLSPSMNLDITVNPDFSQVEVDEQVINLDRFSIFFPERRNFFIENEDLFSNFGFTKIRPFFTRRIGIDDGMLTPIYGGLRLSGKLDEKWRVGLLNIQSAENNNVPSNNYTVACFQKQVFGSSNLGGIFVNKQSVTGEFNRVMGLDYNILSKDNRWRGKIFYHQSFSDDNSSFQYAHASWVSYQRRTMNYTWNHEFVDKYYNAEVGFVPREGRGYWRLEPHVSKFFYSNTSLINRHGPRIYYDLYTNEALEKTDEKVQFSYFIDFQNTSKLNFHATHTFVQLLAPFNPNSKDSLLFPVGGYEWQSLSFNFTPGGRKNSFLTVYADYGSFYLGHKLTVGGQFSYRFEPYLQVSLAVDANDFKMPSPYSNSSLVLLKTKVDMSLSKSVFFSSFIQFNEQTSNLGINTRLQWRFKPMSDLFIVYNSNIFTEDMNPLSTAFLLKLNYWINV